MRGAVPADLSGAESSEGGELRDRRDAPADGAALATAPVGGVARGAGAAIDDSQELIDENASLNCPRGTTDLRGAQSQRSTLN